MHSGRTFRHPWRRKQPVWVLAAVMLYVGGINYWKSIVESLRWTVRLGLADFTLDRQFVGRHGDACRVSFDLASTVPLPVTQAKLVVWPQGFCQSVLKSRDLDGFKDGNPGPGPQGRIRIPFGVKQS